MKKNGSTPSMLLLAVTIVGISAISLSPTLVFAGKRDRVRSGSSLVPNPFFVRPEGVQTHWTSAENPKAEKGGGGKIGYGRKGAACVELKAGENIILAEATGTSGIVRYIWMTIVDRSALMLRGLRLDMYWDGADKPAVSAPLGDFFCHGAGRMATFESALFSSPEGRSYNCFIPMPFRSAMRIELINETSVDLPQLFYTVHYTTGDRLRPDTLYFHAYFNRQNPTVLRQDYEMLPKLEGKGRYLGANIGVRVTEERYFRCWWGEGEVKIYLDGDDAFPTLCGTGTEDYVGTAWGQGEYAHQFMGSPVSDHEKQEFCFYRFHVPDPVYFDRDIRVTIQQIGCWGPKSKEDLAASDKPVYASGPGLPGPELIPVDFSPSGDAPDWGLFERQDDYSSCAYFYLDQPTSNLPPLAPIDARLISEAEDQGLTMPPAD